MNEWQDKLDELRKLGDSLMNKIITTTTSLLIILVLSITVGCSVDHELPFELDEPEEVTESEPLLEEQQPEIEPEPDQELTVIVNVDVLRLRSGPSTDHDILDRLMLGTILQVQEKENEWLEVITPDGKSGWVHGDYVITPTGKLGSLDSDFDPNLPILISYWCPGDEYWSDYGYDFYWRIGQNRLNSSMRFNQLIDLMGEPESIEEIGIDDPNYAQVVLHYPYMVITAMYVTELQVDVGYEIKKEDAIVISVFVNSPQVYGPRDIKVGDSFDSLISKVPNDNNTVEAVPLTFNINGDTVHYEKVLYGSKDVLAPYAEIQYDENKEPLRLAFYDIPYGGFGNGILFVSIKKNQIVDYSMWWQPI